MRRKHISIIRVGEVNEDDNMDCLLLKNFDICIKLILGRLCLEEGLHGARNRRIWKYSAAPVCSVGRFVVHLPRFSSHRDFVRVLSTSEKEMLSMTTHV